MAPMRRAASGEWTLSTRYSPFARSVVGLGGFEPPTSRLSSARSNQLSYRPKALHSKHRCFEHGQRPKRWPRIRWRQALCLSIQRIRPEKKEKRRRRSSACRDLIWSLLFKGDQRVRTIRKLLSPIRSDLRKEVIQPQVPLRLPCYDFTPVAEPTVVACLLAVSATPSGKPNSHGVTGGVYKARERIHRGMLIHDY